MRANDMADQNAEPIVYRYTGTVVEQPLLVEPATHLSLADGDVPPGLVPADPPVVQRIPQQTLGGIPPRDLTQADIDALPEDQRALLEGNAALESGAIYSVVKSQMQAPASTGQPASPAPAQAPTAPAAPQQQPTAPATPPAAK